MRPKLKIGDSILVKKGAEFAHWGIYLSYENGRVEYRPAQKSASALRAIASTWQKMPTPNYCTFEEIIEARDSVSSKQLK